MPKGARKSKTRSDSRFVGNSADTDFTVYHYANADPSSAGTGRMSKAITTWSSKAKQLSTSSNSNMTTNKSEDSLAWYEKDLSAFDLLSDSDDYSDEEIVDNPPTDLKEDLDGDRKPIGRRRRKKLIAAHDNETGNVYPLDLWFHIGSWIAPEQVQTFARICRGCHMVTHCARFWYGLYDRHHNAEANLPATLQPQSMERIHGLRARVIRAIFLMYSPLHQHLQTRSAFEQDPDSLKGASCTLMWYQQVKSHWNFFFKFHLPHNDKFTCPLVNRYSKSQKKVNPLHQAADIHHNPENGYRVLQVVTPNFIPLPPSLMGQMLVKSGLSVSHGMRYHKLKLVFSPQMYLSQNGRNDVMSGTPIVMDPVLNSFVLNWWDPKYPTQPV